MLGAPSPLARLGDTEHPGGRFASQALVTDIFPQIAPLAELPAQEKCLITAPFGVK